MLAPKMSCKLNRESYWNHWFCLVNQPKTPVFGKSFIRIIDKWSMNGVVVIITMTIIIVIYF